jgi:hypothetical protein
MWLVLFMTLAHWAGYELLRDRFGGTWRSVVFRPCNLRGWWWMFYLSLAFRFSGQGTDRLDAVGHSDRDAISAAGSAFRASFSFR